MGIFSSLSTYAIDLKELLIWKPEVLTIFIWLVSFPWYLWNSLWTDSTCSLLCPQPPPRPILTPWQGFGKQSKPWHRNVWHEVTESSWGVLAALSPCETLSPWPRPGSWCVKETRLREPWGEASALCPPCSSRIWGPKGSCPGQVQGGSREPISPLKALSLRLERAGNCDNFWVLMCLICDRLVD